ncbi:hypothetical protein NLJ89_g11464 [Agrocybe chaxingu]|uniref:DUF6534 domain-containing protein n=1 Tax=Agrocybe chaxingu TaxID=84603 RepID=A0A9W8JSA9_9AGAR|nr:hypothetical protein NLJ89_g11464 [Agrocybe chaxingu]
MVDNSATLDPSFPLDNSIGAMMIGVIVSAVLHGICLLQRSCTTRVILTVSFDAIHLAMISHAVYHYAVSYYHDEDQLRFLVWTVLMEALFTGVNGAVVQTFYTLRVWRLSKGNIILTGTILFLILATVGSGTGPRTNSMGHFVNADGHVRDLLKISPLTITINALSTAVDVAIAASLCIMLHNARTGFRKSDTIITKLIIFVVNTGV